MYLYQYKNHFLQNFHTGAMLAYLLTMIVFASMYSHPLFLAGQLVSVYLPRPFLRKKARSLLKTLKWMLPMILVVVAINAYGQQKVAATVLWTGPRLPVIRQDGDQPGSHSLRS